MPSKLRHHHHHHSRFNVRVSALSTGWTVPQMPLLHLSRSCASTLLKPNLSMSPNHLSLPRLTRSATPTIPNRSNKSWDLCLCFSVTPHIHLAIILSVLSNCCESLTFKAHVSLPYTITVCTHAP